jgi:Kdo2-lipid IVA lauroyltransferase/acyltransferase
MLWFLRILAYLPLPVVHFLGGGLGVVILPLAPRARDIRDNLRQAGLPGLGMFLRSAWELGKGSAELLPVWLRTLPQAVGLIREVRGGELVDQARASGRGILVLTPHLGCWELVGAYMAARVPFLALYRPPRQAWADQLMRIGRERGQGRVAKPDMRGVRAMLSALKHGEAVGMLPDQVASKGDGVWAPFFGRQAFTPTLTFRLLDATGAVPLLFFCERLSWGRGYRLRIEALPDLPGDPAAAATLLNREVERLVRLRPEQYLWTYRRYKRPGGAPPPPDESSA